MVCLQLLELYHLIGFGSFIDHNDLFGTLILPPSHFVGPLFHFGMSQNIVLFLKIKIISLLMFLLYPTLFSKLFEKKTN